MDLCPIKNNMSKNLQPHHSHLSSKYISMNLCSSKNVELNLDINNNHCWIDYKQNISWINISPKKTEMRKKYDTSLSSKHFTMVSLIKVHLLPFTWSMLFFKYKVWVEIKYIILMFNWYWFFIHRPSNFNQSFWAPGTMY